MEDLAHEFLTSMMVVWTHPRIRPIKPYIWDQPLLTAMLGGLGEDRGLAAAHCMDSCSPSSF